MSEKNFFKILFGLFSAFLILVPSLNYFIDYYAVFHGANKEYIYGNDINDRFVKMAYLLDNKGVNKYDSYLWGSSRVQKMNTFLTGTDTYNMGSSMGLPSDCLRDIQLLINRNSKIKRVYLGIDDFSYTVDSNAVRSGIFRFPYSDDMKNRSYEYIKLLYCIEPIRLKVKESIIHQIRPITLIGSSGEFVVPEMVELQIENALEQHIHDKKFQKQAKVERWALEDAEEFSIQKESKISEEIKFLNKNNLRVNKCIKVIETIKMLCDKKESSSFRFSIPSI